MTDSTSGLRFDIYERVQLSEEMEGIEELDDIELVPQIELTQQGEQALLKGELLLTGNYLGGQDQRSNQNLEHSIPVEITLPLSRIQRLDDIGVEIENFDVDLLSSRSLNVTGVLSLKGIHMESAREETDWQDEEEAVFIHEADKSQSESEQEIKEVPRLIELESTEAEMEASEARNDEQVDNEAVEVVENEAAEIVENEATKIDDAEEDSGLKIAFNSQKANAEEDNALLVDRIHTQEAREDISAETTAEEAEGVESEDARAEAEWKSLFLTQQDEAEQFSKMRMCIVQKEETIDTIAERYSLNAREIMLYNRLNDQDVSEGQIIYIPS